jgi:predicted dehydrogenase
MAGLTNPKLAGKRLAICGYGRVAAYSRAAVDAHPNLTVAAVADPDATHRAAAGIPAFSTLLELLDAVEVDAVIVSTPTGHHLEAATAALKSGTHVLLEKPATNNLAEFDALSAIADAKMRSLHTAFHARFAPNLDWLVERLDDLTSELGPISLVAATFSDPYWHNGALRPGAQSLGGSWVDSGINALSVIDRLGNDLAVTSLQSQDRCEDVETTAHIGFESGCGEIITSWRKTKSDKRTVLGFANSPTRIRIEHSSHSVWRDDPGKSARCLVTFRPQGHPHPRRLFSHYEGVMNEFDRVLSGEPDNRELSRRLHSELFQPRLQPLMNT